MSNFEETSAATTNDQVKLAKVNSKDEALSADQSGSSNSHSHQRDTNQRDTNHVGVINL